MPAVSNHFARLFARLTRAFAVLVTSLGVLLAGLFPASAFETSAPHAILIDFETGRPLFEKDANVPIPPASLVKLMTAAVLFEALRDGEITDDTEYEVSEYAWRRGGANSGGSTMFLPLRSTVSVGDLLKGIIVQSGNDATIVAAEGLEGSEEAFAERMNALGEKIGLTGSHFTNPHGLPDPDQVVTVRDLATLASWLIREFPDRYPLYSLESFEYNGIEQKNRNPLLGRGADGLKTGHTSAAGYGLVASGTAGERRVVLAISGMDSAAERAREGERLLKYGLQDFEEVVLLPAGEVAETAPVRNGVSDEVGLITSETVKMLVPTGALADVERTVVHNGPVEAPVEAGQRLGWAEFAQDGKIVAQVPLGARDSVPRASFLGQLGERLSLSLVAPE